MRSEGRALAALFVGAAHLAGCAGSPLVVPVGTSGRFPDSVGSHCADAARGSLRVATTDGSTRWHADGRGSLSVSCDKGRIPLEAVPVARLIIERDSPYRIGDSSEFTLRARAEDARGRDIELRLVADAQLVWSADEAVVLRQPRCGHMAPLCVGTVGNGYLMKATLRGERPARVRLRVGANEAEVELGPLPPLKAAPPGRSAARSRRRTSGGPLQLQARAVARAGAVVFGATSAGADAGDRFTSCRKRGVVSPSRSRLSHLRRLSGLNPRPRANFSDDSPLARHAAMPVFPLWFRCGLGHARKDEALSRGPAGGYPPSGYAENTDASTARPATSLARRGVLAGLVGRRGAVSRASWSPGTTADRRECLAGTNVGRAPSRAGGGGSPLTSEQSVVWVAGQRWGARMEARSPRLGGVRCHPRRG